MGAIYLIRHGQASFGADDYDNLSDLGRQQSRLLGKALAKRGIHVNTVYCGSMKRHRQTAESCLNAMNAIRPIHELNTLDEYDHVQIIARHSPHYTDLQTMREDLSRQENPWRAFQQLFSEAVKRWMSDDYSAEYNESWPSFQQRCHQALTNIAKASPKDQNVLVFTSGGPISTICQHLMGLNDERTLSLSWTLVNTGVTKLHNKTSGCQLSVLNEHVHLDEENNLITYR